MTRGANHNAPERRPWHDSPEGLIKYYERRAEAQARANVTGCDHGLERCFFNDYMIHMLPRRENRYGFELRCEVVMPENIDKTQPGHGCRR